jgi:hypothetical protein
VEPDLAVLHSIADALAAHTPRRDWWANTREAGAAHALPSQLEPRVAETAARQGWLLAYLNTRFDDGPVYANLVIVTERAATHALARDPDHAEAVRIASEAYESIRIHRLAVDGPATSHPRIEILETLRIDYSTSPPQRAVDAA